MPAPNPFDQFDSPNMADQLGRPVIVKGPTPVSPTESYHPITPQERTSLGLPSTVPAVVSGSGKPEVISLPSGASTTYRSMSPEEKKAAGLDETQPYFVGSNGLPTLPNGAKGGAAPVDTETARSHVSTILQSIDNATKLLDQPLTSGLSGSIFGHIPGTNAYTLRSLIGDTNDPNNPGQITGDLRQQGISMLRALNGGAGVGSVARSQQEQAALQSAMSNIRQGLPPDQLKQALGNVKQIYLRAYARSYGMDPENQQVQQQFGIDPNYQLPGGNPAAPKTTAQPNVTGAGKDAGITESSALPPLVGAAPEGISTNSEAVTNPALAKIAGQLTTYLNADPKQVSNAQIIGFMQKNGVDPKATNLQQLLEMRATGKYKGFTVDPRTSVPLHGISKVGAEATGIVPAATAAVAGAADTASLGVVPDAAGLIHDVTGVGPSRTDAINTRDMLASSEPTATILGNVAGGFAPLGAAGEASALGRVGKTAAAGGTYGFFGGDNTDIRSRLFNGGLGAILAAAGQGATDGLVRGGQAAYRTAARPVENLLFGPGQTADKFALDAAARKMPTQNLSEVNAADQAAKAAGVPQPAAASINRGGQDFLARTASGSPQARAVADTVAQQTKAAIPQQLADDFNSAIEAAAPRGTDTSAYLNRPVRDIAKDIQGMAGREFERGIEPIKGEKLTLTPDLTGDLEHERVAGAIKDALANHNLSDETRNELRTIIPQLKTLSTAPDIARQAYAKGIPLSVDSARNIATALDRTAGKLADGSEGQVELSRLSRDIRGTIADQFPEYGPVNDRYSSRMRAKEAMYSARQSFFASNPDQQDVLAKASRNFTGEPNPPEFGAEPQVGPGGFQKPVQPLPSNRQLAMTGAREAAQVKAGENSAATADRIASNVNQAGNNATVLGNGAPAVQSRAAVRANVADTVDRVASSGTGDQVEGWFNIVKRAVAMKATGGTSHYALAHAAAATPGLSGDDAARVVRLYLDADSAPQVLQSLSKSYGVRRARFIMARMAAVTSAATGVRGFPAPSP